jgi:GNAT superfamily N-acetyltransferase
VSRPQVIVRPFEDQHEVALMDLFVEGRVEAGGSSEAALRIASAGGLTTVLRRPEVTAFLAFVDDTPVGYLVLSDTLAGPFADSPCTAIDQLFVSAAWRRHGVARQLVATAAAHADRVGAESIISRGPAPQAGRGDRRHRPRGPHRPRGGPPTAPLGAVPGGAPERHRPPGRRLRAPRRCQCRGLG